MRANNSSYVRNIFAFISSFVYASNLESIHLHHHLISLSAVFTSQRILRSKFYRASTNIEKIFLVKFFLLLWIFSSQIDRMTDEEFSHAKRGKYFSASECFPRKSYFWCLTSCKNSFHLKLTLHFWALGNLINNAKGIFFLSLPSSKQQTTVFCIPWRNFIFMNISVLFDTMCTSWCIQQVIPQTARAWCATKMENLNLTLCIFYR